MTTKTTLEENGTDDEIETCPNGNEWCATTDDDEIGCFDCFCDEEREADDENDREVATDGGVDVGAAAVDTEDVDDLTDREIRALTERLVVLEEAPGMATVFSEDGTPRTVDFEDGACDCPDATYNSPPGGCKHLHAARFLVGDREIPEWVDRDEMNAQVARRSGE